MPEKHSARPAGSASEATLGYKVNATTATYVLNLTSNEKKSLPRIEANGILKGSLPGHHAWEVWVIAEREDPQSQPQDQTPQKP